MRLLRSVSNGGSFSRFQIPEQGRGLRRCFLSTSASSLSGHPVFPRSREKSTARKSPPSLRFSFISAALLSYKSKAVGPGSALFCRSGGLHPDRRQPSPLRAALSGHSLASGREFCSLPTPYVPVQLWTLTCGFPSGIIC